MNGGLYRAPHICPHCHFEHPSNKKTPKSLAQQSAMAPQPMQPRTVAAEAVAVTAQSSVATQPTPIPAKQTHTEPLKPEEAPAEPVKPQSASHKPVVAISTTSTLTTRPITTSTTASIPTAAPSTSTKANTAPKARPNPSLASHLATANLATASPVTASTMTGTPKSHAPKAKAPIADITQPKPAKTQPKKVGADITLTASPSYELHALKLFEEVSATCILNIELTADLFIKGKFAGVKSPKIQAALKQGKKDTLGQLRKIARDLGANVVADIEIKNAMKMVDQNNANITVNASGTALLADNPMVDDATTMTGTL